MLLYIILVASGILLAFGGRRLVWLLMAAIGFFIGYSLAGLFFSGGDEAIQLAIGLAAGVGSALLTRGFTRFLLRAAGFILVGGLAATLASELGIAEDLLRLGIFVLGGLLGVGLVSFAFELSLILFTALGGGALIFEGLSKLFEPMSRELGYLIGMLIAVIGFLVQWQGWKKH